MLTPLLAFKLLLKKSIGNRTLEMVVKLNVESYISEAYQFVDRLNISTASLLLEN
jgi:hypothetical protein